MNTNSVIQYAGSEPKRMAVDGLFLPVSAGRCGEVRPEISGRCAVGFGIPEGFQLKQGGGTWKK